MGKVGAFREMGRNGGHLTHGQNGREFESLEPVSCEPVSCEPVSCEPVSREPVSCEPVPVERGVIGARELHHLIEGEAEHMHHLVDEQLEHLVHLLRVVPTALKKRI